MTPLCIAAESGDTATVRVLLQHGASPHPILKDGEEPPIEPAWSYRIPLFSAARGGSGECVRLLLNAGARIETVDVSGTTALMHASSRETVRELIAAGCLIDARANLQTALHHVVAEGFHEAVFALVEAGADIEAGTSFGDPPLISHCMSFEMNAPMIQTLLAAGANLHARWFRGRTALHEAVQALCGDRFPHFESAIRTLVAAGLDVNVRDDKGSTPLHYALVPRPRE